MSYMLLLVKHIINELSSTIAFLDQLYYYLTTTLRPSRVNDGGDCTRGLPAGVLKVLTTRCRPLESTTMTSIWRLWPCSTWNQQEMSFERTKKEKQKQRGDQTHNSSLGSR